MSIVDSYHNMLGAPLSPPDDPPPTLNVLCPVQTSYRHQPSAIMPHLTSVKRNQQPNRFGRDLTSSVWLRMGTMTPGSSSPYGYDPGGDIKEATLSALRTLSTDIGRYTVDTIEGVVGIRLRVLLIRMGNDRLCLDLTVMHAKSRVVPMQPCPHSMGLGPLTSSTRMRTATLVIGSVSAISTIHVLFIHTARRGGPAKVIGTNAMDSNSGTALHILHRQEDENPFMSVLTIACNLVNDSSRLHNVMSGGRCRTGLKPCGYPSIGSSDGSTFLSLSLLIQLDHTVPMQQSEMDDADICNREHRPILLDETHHVLIAPVNGQAHRSSLTGPVSERTSDTNITLWKGVFAMRPIWEWIVGDLVVYFNLVRANPRSRDGVNYAQLGVSGTSKPNMAPVRKKRTNHLPCQGHIGYVGVTSASSPTFASILSMVNDTRIREKKKGFSESVAVLHGFSENMYLQRFSLLKNVRLSDTSKLGGTMVPMRTCRGRCPSKNLTVGSQMRNLKIGWLWRRSYPSPTRTKGNMFTTTTRRLPPSL
ncbi:hypothetical protein EDD15DRAFT_2197620 [Pisolithus albus]|nr:hypothetical protein EDD15DRAFT_2197620 [Pisolithus albus]